MTVTAPEVDVPAFTAHTQQFLTGWLNDFAWEGQPLAGALTSITGHALRSDETGPEMVLWQRTGDAWLSPLDEAPGSPDMTVWTALTEDPFDERWDDVVEEYRLTGTWLHPDTTWDLNGYAWATGASALAVGTLDRDDPTAPRKFDPAQRCDVNDLGVIFFPTRAMFRLPEWIAAGHTPARACIYTIVAALAEGGTHESMEMWQSEPGRPIWDPHNRNAPTLSLTVTFADGTTVTGTAH
jgi:hypothetical protein